MKFRKTINLTVGVIIFLYVGVTLWVWNNSVTEIQNICSQIESGQPLLSVLDLVENSRYSRMDDPAEKDGQTLASIHSSKNMGRAVCLVEILNDEIISATYNYHD